MLEQYDLEQNHRVDAGPSIFLAVQRFHELIQFPELYRLVHLPQQMLLGHRGLCIYQFHHASLHFPLFYYFSHPVSYYLLNAKKSAPTQTFSTA